MAQFTNSQAAAEAVKAGAISQRAATLLSQANPTGLVDYAEVKRTFDDVRMSCFIIDASGSMEPCRDAVIQRQQGMVNMLRKSSKCRKNALYIGQWLFAESPSKLNPYTLLNVNGGDGVVLLDQGWRVKLSVNWAWGWLQFTRSMHLPPAVQPRRAGR